MRLTDEDIRRRLPEIEGWDYDGKQLGRLFLWPSFMAAIRFVNRVAEEAEAAGHHPSIDIRYDAVKLTVFTHSENAVTEKDFALARAINDAALAL